MDYKFSPYFSLNTRLLGLSSIIAFLFIIYNLYVLKSYNPIGYDIYIYKQLSSKFWSLLIFTYLIGTLLILQNNNLMFKKLGFLILTMNYIVYLIVPYQLGYYIVGNSDDLSYLGQINYIVKTAHIDPGNIYPASHTIFSQIALISNMATDRISILLPAYFSLLFVIGTIIFSNSMVRSKIIFYILFPVSVVFYLRYMHFSIAPHYIYFTSVPLFLFILNKYFFEKNNVSAYSILLVIFILIIPYSHPFIILYIAYSLAGVSLFYIYMKKGGNKPYNVLLLLFIATVLWVFTNSTYMDAFAAYASHTFAEDFDRSVTMRGLDTISKANQGLFWTDILGTFILLYSRYILPLIVISIATIKWAHNKEFMGDLRRPFEISLLFYIFCAFFDIILVVNPYVNHTVERLTTLNCTVYAQIPIFAISLYILFLKKSTIKSYLIVSSLLTLVLFISIFGSLDSPYIYKSNTAVSFNEVQGMDWWFDHGNKEYIITSPLNPQIGFRYSSLFLEWCKSEHAESLPPHFGYNDETFNLENIYISIMRGDEVHYGSVIKFKKDKEEAYNNSDFKRLSSDPDVIKLYDSLNIDIYKA